MEPNHTSTARIAVIDSGIGGTSVLEAVRRRAPWADVVYVADHAFGPYGERTLTEVRDRTELLARYLDTAGIDLAVIACNSASAAALHHLREHLPHLAFVGMEIRQNTLAVQSATTQAISDQAMELTLALATDERLPQLVYSMTNDGITRSDLESEDFQRLSLSIIAGLRRQA